MSYKVVSFNPVISGSGSANDVASEMAFIHVDGKKMLVTKGNVVIGEKDISKNLAKQLSIKS